MPATGVKEVRFYLDDPSMAKAPRKVERGAPHDFAGSASNGDALPFDTTDIDDGAHVITAAIFLTSGGQELVHGNFTVANGSGEPPPPPPGSYELRLSLAPDRSAPVPLDGAFVAGNAYVFTAPSTDVKEVRFYLDDPSMAKAPRKVERGAPHDFAGSASNGDALPFDTTGIDDGAHVITAAIFLTSGGQELVHGNFTVANGSGEPLPPPPDSYELRLSLAPDRSAPVPLDGAFVAGNAYVFTAPSTDVKEVRFYLDDPSMAKAPRKVERGAPHDFAGSASNGDALPFDTTDIDDGAHVITAAIFLTSGGQELVHGNFTVANAAPALRFAPSAVGFGADPGTSPEAQAVRLEASDGTGATYTATDDASWLTIAPAHGSTPSTIDLDVDAAGLAAGTYTATVTASADGYATGTLAVVLDIVGSQPPDQVHLAWVDDPATTMTVVWRTRSAAAPSRVEYRLSNAGAWQTETSAFRPSGASGTLHEATLTSLAPASTYDYRLRGDGGAWSDVFTARTAPPRGPADFDAVYVADTGIVGRADGLTTGTQRIVDEIAALRPTVVLLGGDYAYYNTETRFGTLDDAIDAWFNQMQPIGAYSPMMVSYGNHEILLSEGFAPWAARFATPAGHDDRRHYSFDVGDVHFVSILAVTESGGLSSSTLSWIESDVTAARAAGARWIVPFFHVAPFSDGKNHPSNLDLRGQLGPLFERLGVKIAISSHDQSYERTYPLTDVPARNAPTTLRKRCYTQADGVTWLKVSPGGKLSNKNRSFSAFATSPPPAWTAFRDNTMHHFLRLLVSASGTLTAQVYGLTGDASPAVIIDEFTYTLDSCAAELALAPETIELSVDPENPLASRALGVSTSDGEAAAMLSSAAPWLSASPGTVATPGTAQAIADGTGLPAGTYRTTLTATADGFVSTAASVTLTVHDLLVSRRPDRAAPERLRGSTLAGDAYIYVPTGGGVKQVRFWLDNPGLTGSPRKVEKSAPFDFAGTATDGSALLFDTDRIADGTHTISAALDLADGRTYTLHGTFAVDND